MDGIQKRTEEDGVVQKKDIHDTMEDNSTERVEMKVINEKNEVEGRESIITIDKVPDEDENWHDDESGVDDDKTSRISYGVEWIQQLAKRLFKLSQRLTSGFFWPVVLLAGYTAYFSYAMVYEYGDTGSIRLLVCTILGVIIITRHAVVGGVRRLYHRIVGEGGMSPEAQRKVNRARMISRWVMYAGLLSFVVWILEEEWQKKPQNLIGIPGLFCMILMCLLFSSNPKKINWYTIIWSIGLQFAFAVCTLKYTFGREATIWIQTRLEEFFASSQEAFVFLFGAEYQKHGVVFNGFPLSIFMSATMGLLYYIGVMQFVVGVMGNAFKFVLDVHHLESVAVSGGIFLEGSMVLVSVRPFLKSVTRSELFTIITSIFSSMGASFLAVLKGFEIPLRHVIPAMLISAPATFLVCKLMVPEGRRNKKEAQQDADKDEKAPSNLLDAYQAGAVLSLTFLGNVVVAIFAFMSGMTWLNNTMEWFGDRVGVEGFTTDFVLSYLFYPVALAMGVVPSECRGVARFLGIRLFAGNIVAFQQLKVSMANRQIYENFMMATNYTGTVDYFGDDILLDTAPNATLLQNGFLSARSEVISIYSMCGFSSVASVGIMLATLGVFIPKRRAWLSKVAIFALLAGNIANCMTGTFASIFFQEE